MDNQYSVSIRWMPGDVQTLRPDWSHEQCEEWLKVNARHIQDRSVERGWQVLEELMDFDGV